MPLPETMTTGSTHPFSLASEPAVAAAFALTGEDPYETVRALQAAFDPAGLRFSEEYYDVLGLEPPPPVR